MDAAAVQLYESALTTNRWKKRLTISKCTIRRMLNEERVAMRAMGTRRRRNDADQS
jgi:hypothetical protein